MMNETDIEMKKVIVRGGKIHMENGSTWEEVRCYGERVGHWKKTWRIKMIERTGSGALWTAGERTTQAKAVPMQRS